VSRVVLFNKPYGVLCQFTGNGTRRTLADFLPMPDVYPAGRLDADSEGLVVLTADGALQARIADPRFKLPKLYWAQVEGEPAEAQLGQLRQGVTIGAWLTRPARVQRIGEPALWARDPPIRVRREIPTAWLAIEIAEGKNRQVRRMTAAVGLPTLRLVRVRVGPWALGDLAPGSWREEAVRSPVLSSAAVQGPAAAGSRPSPGRSRSTNPRR
jgi:23S rRNA pseudouridine2457 synthase